MLTQAAVTVGEAATLLFRQQQYAGSIVSITNLDASINLLLGSSNVTRSLFAHEVAKGGGSHEIFIPYGESIYGITASGSTTITVNILTVGQLS